LPLGSKIKEEKMTRLTKNFTLEELYKNSKAPNDFQIEYLYDLCRNCLQPIRDKFGVVNISSGYRDREYNKKVGGVENSQHIKGQAVDFTTPNANLKEVFEWICAGGIGFDQVIFETKNTQWIHLSFNLANNRGQAFTAVFVNGKAVYTPVELPIKL